MGLDLRLLPFECDHGDWAFSHSILSCDSGGMFWDLIATAQLPMLQVPKDFSTFLCRDSDAESHYGNTQETPYGEPLLYTTVEHLLKIQLPVNASRKNAAVWAYLRELEPRTKVALFWH